MTDPVSFTSVSPRLGLPLLIAAQAQKEVFVNEALARIDALLHPAVEGEADTPPALPAEGECWIVGPSPTGEWSGQASSLACRQGGNWLFAAPVEGMRVFDKAATRYAVFSTAWQRAAAVVEPTGGATVDTQARAAITGLIAALVAAGVLD